MLLPRRVQTKVAVEPAMFNQTTGYETSTKYVPINTAGLVSQFETAGFTLAGTSAARVRNAARQGFQKHLFTFRHADMQLRGQDDVLPQIVLKNSYDGTSSLQIMLGVYRLVCANGLIVGSTWDMLRVRHVGSNAVSDALHGAFKLVGNASKLAETIQAMKSTQLSLDGKLHLANAAANLIAPETAVTVKLSSLLTPRREADVSDDLWTVFNRVQENVMRGGLQYTTLNVNDEIRQRVSRGVRSIDASVKFNQILWTAAEEMLSA